MGSEQSILSENKMGSHVEAIGTYYLILSSGFVLKLEKTFYVPSFSKNLISVSRLVPFEYSFTFSGSSFSLFYKSNCVGNGTLFDGLYCINLQNNATYDLMHVHTGIKRCVINEDFSKLWHRILSHISIERIKRLVNEEVLNTLLHASPSCFLIKCFAHFPLASFGFANPARNSKCGLLIQNQSTMC